MLGALAIIMFTVVGFYFFPIPFNMMLETTYVNSNKVLELVLSVFKRFNFKGVNYNIYLKDNKSRY